MTKPLIFGMDAEREVLRDIGGGRSFPLNRRPWSELFSNSGEVQGISHQGSHVVERHGQGVYAEHVALVYTPKDREHSFWFAFGDAGVAVDTLSSPCCPHSVMQ